MLCHCPFWNGFNISKRGGLLDWWDAFGGYGILWKFFSTV